MNIENAKKLVGQLERLPFEQFDMTVVLEHDCRTVGCIAGWASFLNGGPKKTSADILGWSRDFLGLDETTARNLFLNDNEPNLFLNDNEPTIKPLYFHASGERKYLWEITRVDATAALQRMIAEAEAP